MPMATTPMLLLLRRAAPQHRALATASAAAASTANRIPLRAPVQLNSLEGKYATAAFNAAAREDALDPVAADMGRLHAALAKSPAFRRMLESPEADRAAKSAFIARLSEGLKLAPTSASLLRVLLQNGRLALTQAVAVAFEALMRAHRREVAVCITSATPLDKSVEQRVLQALRTARLIDANQNVQVSTKVSAAILGGLVVEVGDSTIDLSAASKLAKITKALEESV